MPSAIDVEEYNTEVSFETIRTILNAQASTPEVEADKNYVKGNYALFQSMKGKSEVPYEARYDTARILRNANRQLEEKYSKMYEPSRGEPKPAPPQGGGGGGGGGKTPTQPKTEEKKTAKDDGPGMGVLLVAAAAAFLLLRGK